ncbi:MAG: histidine kinase dimerization/phosphoacceptor domain -containing protein [Balneolales bacterium]
MRHARKRDDLISAGLDQERDQASFTDAQSLNKTGLQVNKPLQSDAGNYSVITLDADGCIVSLNREAEKLTGNDLKDVEGQHYSTLIADPDAVKSLQEKEPAPVPHSGGTADVLKAMAGKRAVENELSLQRTYFNQLFESSPEGVVMLDSKDYIIDANRAFQRLFKYSKRELLGENINELIIPESKPGIKTKYKAVGHNSHQIETVRQCKDGKLIDVSIIGAPIEHNDHIVGVFGIYRDITLQKSDENTIKRSLQEKEVLLQEIHHRVKNNMQIISSLHNLQAKQLKDEKTLSIFKESQNRVQAMALIHDQLYQSKDLAHIDFGSYLQDLMHQLFASFGSKNITYAVNSDQVSFNINQAVPCGLIVNELVTNCIKHAFSDGQAGNIEVNIREVNNEQFLLEVSDNGAGFPTNVDFRNTSSSLGLQLVNGLVGQIRGKLSLSREKETRFSIYLPK